MTPHRIEEIRGCGGVLVRAQDSITLKNDAGECTVGVNATTRIWRGETTHDTRILRPGDEVLARAVVDCTAGILRADDVEANVAKAEGTIVSLARDRMVVVEEWNDRRWRTTVFFDSRTRFNLGEDKLKTGATVMAIGLQLGKNRFRATTLTVERCYDSASRDESRNSPLLGVFAWRRLPLVRYSRSQSS